MRPELRRYLLDAGASESDLARAESQGWLPLLTLDRLVAPGRPMHDMAAVARLAGSDEDRLRRLWRAVGFPDVPSGLAVFTDDDVDAARRVMQGGFAQPSDFEAVLRHIRAISASMARVAAVVAETYGDAIRDERARGVGDEEIASELIDDFNGDDLASLLVYSARLQLRAAVWRRLSRDADPDLAVAIGFADLAGYTALSAGLDADRLAAFVGEWEEVAYDTVAQLGGRVVKTIGDEVMFAGLSTQIARTAVALRDRARERHLPEVRAGIAAGMVIARDGDFYGPVVNLASRLTDIAPAGAVYASDALHAELAGDSAFAWTPVGSREVRSIGSVDVFQLDSALGIVR